MTDNLLRRITHRDAASPDAGAGEARPLKLFIKSFGCQMNAYDASRMADVLAPEGYAETATIEEADLVVLNTCHIRERAAEKIYSELGKIREMKEAAGRQVTLAVAGCVAQAEGAEIIRRQRAVDLVVGPQSCHGLPDVVRRARAPSRIGRTTAIAAIMAPRTQSYRGRTISSNHGIICASTHHLAAIQRQSSFQSTEFERR